MGGIGKKEAFHLERGKLGITVDFVAWLSTVSLGSRARADWGVWGGNFNSLIG